MPTLTTTTIPNKTKIYEKIQKKDMLLWVSCVLVSLVWGFTNCLLKRYSKGISESSNDLLFLLKRWKYLCSLCANLCGSVLFYVLLKDHDVSIVVPLVNTLTFATTTVFGVLFFHEKVSTQALSGLALIAVGITLMTS